MSDPRFARFKTDPRFRKIRKKQHKVVVDERFKSVFEDKKTRGKKIDKYGRNVAASKDTDNLKRFYRVQDEDDEPKPAGPDYARGEVLMESSSEEEYEKAEEKDSDAEDEIVVLGANSQKAMSRRTEEPEVDLDESQFPELDALAESNIAEENEEGISANSSGDQTNRLAVVNLDWDHVKAYHLYKVLSSVLTSGGRDKRAVRSSRGKVVSVRIYLSQFGKERIEREDKEGPPKEIFKKSNTEDEEEGTNVIEEDDGKEYDEEALRRYQLERLRYYYAIVTCDTVEAAMHIYSELDGTELERSANMFNLSYVPNDMTFDEEFTDEATQETGMEYKGLEFSTDALRHSKVKLTWDNDDPERMKVTKRALSKREIEEADFKAYIASSESEDEEGKGGKNAQRERLRNLLLGASNEDSELMPEGWGESYDKAKEMEITFTPGLSSKDQEIDENEETTMQRYLRKQREKRKQRKATKGENTETEKSANKEEDEFFGEDSNEDVEEPTNAKKELSSKKKKKNELKVDPRQEASVEELARLVSSGNASNEPRHFDMKSIIKAEKVSSKKARKRNKKQLKETQEEELQEDFRIDVSDDRFKALHEDHAYAIDPSNPHFKKTKNMATLLEERAKRQGSSLQTEEGHPLTKGQDQSVRSLSSLVESVKRKSVVALEHRRSKKSKV